MTFKNIFITTKICFKQIAIKGVGISPLMTDNALFMDALDLPIKWKDGNVLEKMRCTDCSY